MIAKKKIMKKLIVVFLCLALVGVATLLTLLV